jgi:hypothetical protein
MNTYEIRDIDWAYQMSDEIIRARALASMECPCTLLDLTLPIDRRYLECRIEDGIVGGN